MPAENPSEPLTGDEQPLTAPEVGQAGSPTLEAAEDGYDPFADLPLEESFPEAEPEVRLLMPPDPILRPQPVAEETENTVTNTLATETAAEAPTSEPLSPHATPVSTIERDQSAPAVETDEAPASLEEVNLTALDLPWLAAEVEDKPRWQELAEHSGGLTIIAVITLGAAGLLGLLYAFGSAVAGGIFGG